MSPRTFFRSLALAEAVTWALLILAMIAKYGLQVGDWPVSIAGFLHGLVFLAYAMAALVVGVNQRWRLRLIVLAVGTSVVPFLTIPVDRWLERKNLLDGGWRGTATAHPADGQAPSVVLRWLLRSPALFATGFVVVLGVVMATLMFVGPPGGGA